MGKSTKYYMPDFVIGLVGHNKTNKKSWYNGIYKEADCIVCHNKVNQDGYVRIWDNEDSKLSMVHNVIWRHVNGPIPEGMEINHLCSNRKCFNPDHLELLCGSIHATISNINRIGYKMNRMSWEEVAERYYLIKRKLMSINEVVKEYLVKRSTLSSIMNKRSRVDVTSLVDDYISMEFSILQKLG